MKSGGEIIPRFSYNITAEWIMIFFWHVWKICVKIGGTEVKTELL